MCGFLFSSSLSWKGNECPYNSQMGYYQQLHTVPHLAFRKASVMLSLPFTNFLN